MMVATSTHGLFNPLPSYSGRVKAAGSAGLVVTNATKGDTGNFSVTITATDAENQAVTLQRTAVVIVGGGCYV